MTSPNEKALEAAWNVQNSKSDRSFFEDMEVACQAYLSSLLDDERVVTAATKAMKASEASNSIDAPETYEHPLPTYRFLSQRAFQTLKDIATKGDL